MGQTSSLRALAVALALLAVIPLSACRGASASTELTVSGSTTVLPIAEVTGEDFGKAHPDVRVLASGVGSSAGIESVARGSADIGTSSRDLKPEELSLGLVPTPIAYDAIAVIVNPANPVKNLTMEQVRDIFQGKITNWSAVGGPDLPIGLVNRDEASGTREAFTKLVLKGGVFDPKAAVLPGTGQVRAVVSTSPSAIGYISYGFVTAEVHALSIDGVAPSPETVAGGQYPVRRKLYMITKGDASGLAKTYMDYVLSSGVQDTTIREAGFLPVTGAAK